MNRQDLKDLAAQLAECRKQHKTEAELKVAPDLCAYLTRDHACCLRRLLAMADYEVDCKIRYTDDTIRLSGLQGSMDPKCYARNEEEMRKVLWIAVTRGIRAFRVLVQPDFFGQLMKDDWELLHNLSRDAVIGFNDWSWYTSVCLIHFRNCRPIDCPRDYGGPATYRPKKQTGEIGTEQDDVQESPLFRSLGTAIRYTEAMASRLAGHISFRCSSELHRLLFHQGVPDKYGEPLLMFEDLIGHAGILRASVYGWEQTRRFDAYYIEYYPGFALAQMVRNNRLDLATERQQKLLAAAQELVGGIGKRDAAETALMISHELGKRTVFVDDETTDDDDCAYGPLINGQANCDGFADAFYLCAVLAGLSVRFQHGDARELTGSSENRSHHMWNLVKINNAWVMLDATWDRPGNHEGMEWIHCMIGADRAEKLYRWNHSMTPTLARETDLFRAPEVHEFYVASAEDIRAVVRQVKKQKIGTFWLIAAEPDLIRDHHEIHKMIARSGIPGRAVYTENKKLCAWKVLLESYEKRR